MVTIAILKTIYSLGINTKQGLEELYTQRLEKENICRLKLSSLRLHRLRLYMLKLYGSEAGGGGGGSMKLYTPL